MRRVLELWMRRNGRFQICRRKKFKKRSKKNQGRRHKFQTNQQSPKQ